VIHCDNDRNVDARPTPLVICGPSGVGKGTLIKMLMSNYKVFGFSVSNTTRAPREGEVDGVHYNFMTKERFQEGVQNQEFIEHANVHTNMYGTTFAGVDRVSLKYHGSCTLMVVMASQLIVV
jgi:guanylate kinase